MRQRCIVVILLVVGVFSAAAGLTAPERMSVQIREGVFRTGPSFLARPAGVLKYADKVAVLTRQSGWCRIRTLSSPPAEGWIHESALTQRRLELAAGSEDAAGIARSDELALAGKGFNESVEESYREAHRDLDYRWVDRMETYTVPQGEIQAFLEAGGVTGKRGLP